MKLYPSRRAAIRVLLLVIVFALPHPALASKIVVGDGTPLSCTADAFKDALAAAADAGPDDRIIRFKCGDEPLTLVAPVQERLLIPDRTTIDGGDRVTISPVLGGFTVAVDSSVTILRLGLKGFGPGYYGIINFGNLEVRRSVIGDRGGPLIMNRGGIVTVTDTVFGFGFTGSGIEGNGTLRVDHSTFEHPFTSKWGGAVISTSGVLEIKNSVVRNYHSEYYGAISHNGDANIQNCEFTDNSGNFGGAITVFNGTLTIKNSTFVRNNARWGGAVAFRSGSSLIVKASEFYDNRAAYGGAILNHGSLLMRNSVVTRNTVGCCETVGGGIWTTTEPVLKHTTVAGNTPDDIFIQP
jgi:hypothetical protein